MHRLIYLTVHYQSCLDLAASLVPDGVPHDAMRAALAQHIHSAVEDWLNLEWDRMRAGLPLPPERAST
jgi:hypothetical protein